MGHMKESNFCDDENKFPHIELARDQCHEEGFRFYQLILSWKKLNATNTASNFQMISLYSGR